MSKGTAVPAETADEIARLRAEGVIRTEIARRLNVSTQTVTRYGRPRGDESQRQRLLALIAERGPLDDKAIGEALPETDLHNLVHLAFMLRRGGLITFDERRRGSSRRLLRVTVTQEGWREVESQRVRVGTEIPAFPATVMADEIAARAAEIASHPSTEVPALPRFPAIVAEVKRRELLTEAADLAEAAGEVEIAIALLASLDHGEIASEAIRLFEVARDAGLVE